MEKSGTINGFKWNAEPFRPTSIQASFMCNSLAELRQIFPQVQEKILSDFSNEVMTMAPLVPGADGTTFCHPVTVGIFLFDPGWGSPGQPGYRKPGSKLGNYLVDKPFTKDSDPVKLAEKCFDQAADGLKDTGTDVNAKGLGLQFAYFSPLAVQIGLEWGTKVKDDGQS